MAKPGAAKKSAGVKLDLATIAGLIIAIGAITGGLVLEGGKISDITQLTAAMIVLGGTIGAVMVTTPMSILIKAAKAFKEVFFETSESLDERIEEVIALATKARKNSIVSLENDLDNLADPFLKKALSLAVDGADLQDIRKIMELDMVVADHRAEAEAKVYEAAGGYAPTIGIIGAVLGLIQVMKHLENIEEVGRGIAVAFVATVYGVASSNLLFLPVANKIKARSHHMMQCKELILEGVCSIVEGMNPKLIRVKLDAFVEAAPTKDNAGAKAAKSAAQTVQA